MPKIMDAGVNERGDVVFIVDSPQIKPTEEGGIAEVQPMWSRHDPIQFDGWK